MNLPSKILAAALLASIPAWSAGSAAAAPMGASSVLNESAGAPVQMVDWRGSHRGWGGWGGRGWSGPAAGLAAGAIIGGALAASQPWYGYGYGRDYGYDYSPGYYSGGYDGGYDPGYSSYGYDTGYAAPGGYMAAPGGDSVGYCSQRFRSYDPASGTYLGYDGYRHPCP